MAEKTVKNSITKALSFILVFSMLLFSLYGCKDKEKENPTKQAETTKPTASSTAESTTAKEDKTDEESDEKSDGKTDKDGKGSSSQNHKKPRPGKGGQKTTKKHSQGGSGATRATQPPAPQTTKSNTYYAPKVYSNSAPGSATFSSSDGSATVDYSNASSGYVMVSYSGGYSNIRIQVIGPNGVTQTYPLFTRGSYEALPLTGGSGSYTIKVLANNGGNSYVVVVSQAINASLSYSTVAFSRPNIIVNYNYSTTCVQQAANITRGCDSDLAKVEAIYKYVVNNFRYDRAKASQVSNQAYVPNLNSTWSTKTGICYDYAAVMTAMLRTQGLPTKLEVGDTNYGYHAWLSVYVSGSGWIDNIIYFNGNSWKLLDPTFASTGGNKDWSKDPHHVRYVY